MSNVPFVDTDATVEKAKQEARNLIDWLPDPHTCPECNTMCEASQTWDPQMCEPVHSWQCPNCSQHYRRQEPWHD